MDFLLGLIAGLIIGMLMALGVYLIHLDEL